MMLFNTEESLLYRAKQAEGKSFGDIDKKGRMENKKAKGQLGQVVEESFFGYEINSKKEADFAELGIELKVTPVKENKNGTLSAKERLVLNIINYHEEVGYTFYESSFWRKNEKLLMMFYRWQPSMDRSDYQIIKSYLHTYPKGDLAVIEQDWQIIVDKIRLGKAHELSEADTNYLSACTKGATSKSSFRTQPFGQEQAKQRAFSLKQSYMTTLIRKIIHREDLVPFTTNQELQNQTLLQLLQGKFSPYMGMSLEAISQQTGIKVNYKSKGFLPEFISRLLGIRGTKLNQIDEFQKANIRVKTIRLEPNDRPKEHMSFKNIDLEKWSREQWETSWVREYFSVNKFLFVIFHYNETEKENPNRKLYFSGIVLWNMPMNEIEGKLRTFWEHVQHLIYEGIHLIPKQQKNGVIIKNNLPKPGFNGLCHIRPKARDGNDKVSLPDGRMITNQAFWLDREYVQQICKKVNGGN